MAINQQPYKIHTSSLLLPLPCLLVCSIYHDHPHPPESTIRLGEVMTTTPFPSRTESPDVGIGVLGRCTESCRNLHLECMVDVEWKTCWASIAAPNGAGAGVCCLRRSLEMFRVWSDLEMIFRISCFHSLSQQYRCFATFGKGFCQNA